MQCTLCFFLIAFSFSNANLLEMSQILWSKFLNGGLSNIGSLDPLRIPLVKVDQSHGQTTYRMILNNVQISGLNASTLESIHIGRGSVKSNSSEMEAGFVSYSDQNTINSIRYRFHMVNKQPSEFSQDAEKLQVEPIEAFEDVGSKTQDVLLHRTYTNQDEQRKYVNQNQQPARYQQYQEYRNERYQSQGHPMVGSQLNSRPYNDQVRDRSDQQEYHRHQQNYHRNQDQDQNSRQTYTTSFPNNRNREYQDRTVHLVYAHQQMNIDNQNRFKNDNERLMNNQGQKGPDRVSDGSMNTKIYRGFDNRENQMRYSAISKTLPCGHEHYERSRVRMEDQPGFIDVIYANEPIRAKPHFANLKVEKKENETVFKLQDIFRDLENYGKFLIHNFTQHQSLLKNDPMRIAEETKKIENLIRYAGEFQEKHGYFEEGMELIYHYGNENGSKTLDGKRTKRAHAEEPDNEDDIIHVVTKIRIPQLSVKAGYSLIGKVGKQDLRGNGQLSGNFTELVGHFTIELKKIGDSSLMVRATRAKLVADSKNVILQGMDENGPVKEILTQGLMAAEAVAAMLVDDLATKVLNETTNDAIIYKIYKDLPNN